MGVQKFTLSGIDKVLIGPASTSSTLTGMIDVTEYVVPGTLQRTKNVDSIERLVADGKSYAYVTFATPGDPDKIQLSLLDQSPEIEQLMTNVVYDATTSTVTDLATRKIANFSMQIFTSFKNGKKAVITIPNISGTMGTADAITFNNVEKFVINGDLNSFVTNGGLTAVSTKQWLNIAGVPINGAPATVSAGAANQTATINPKVLVGTATPAAGKTIVSQLWVQTSGPNTSISATPTALSNSVSGLVTGVYVFTLTVTDSAGVETSASTTLTATI